MIKFISYDGKYPCLCMGTLTIEVEGKIYKLNSILSSGGSCGFTNDYADSYVYNGEWGISGLPDELEKYREELEELVNENIEQGCCGGCL